MSRVESVCTDLPAKGPTGPFCLVHLQMLPCPHGVVPVAEVEDAGRAVALAQALEAGGLRELHQAPTRLNLEVLDRVGGGNSFASGLVYAFLSGLSPAEAVAWGAAHGALAMTTPGDASMATRDEVDRVLHGSMGRVAR